MKALLAAVLLTGLLPGAALAQSADQEVVSVVDAPDPVAPGAALTYTVTVRNNGPDAASNGGLNVNLPLAATHTSDVVPAGWTCFWLGSNGTCNTPSFAAGSTVVLTINTLVDASLAAFPDQSISANFFPSGTTPDPNNANNAKSATTQVDSPQVDLSVAATDSPDPVSPDGTVTYSVAVTNDGPDTATGVSFNVAPNASLAFQSATLPAGWTCALPAVGALNAAFTCSRFSFAPGASQFTIAFVANDEQFGIGDTSIQTSFNVDAGGSNETDTTDNSTTVTTQYTTPDADLSITATDSPDPVLADSDITYTVTLVNQGPDAAAATLEVPMNGTLALVAISVPAGFSCSSVPPVGGSSTFSCSNPSFANGASAVFTVVLRADADVFGNQDQTIVQTFAVSGDVSDPDSADNTVDVSTAYVAPDADLSVSALGSPDPVAPGDTITFTGTIANAGPDPAANVVLSVALDPDVRFVSLTGPSGFTCVTPAVGVTGPVTCTATSIGSQGFAAPFTLVVDLDPALAGGPGGTVAQQFTITSETSDPDPLDDTVTVTTTYLGATADLAVTKTTNVTTAVVGTAFDYTIVLTNNGPGAANAAVLTDVLPASLQFQSLVAPAGYTCTTPAIGATGTITCTAATLANGATAVFTLTVLAGASSGTVANSASVASATTDPDPGNGSATSPGVVLGPVSADLSITKTTTATTATTGSTVTYTIIVANAGPGPATDVVVTDILPSGLAFASATPSQGTCNVTGSVTCPLGTLVPGASATITLSTTVAAASGTVTNTASVASTEPDPSPGDRSATTSPLTVAGAPPTEPAAAPLLVPALSPWMLLALAALLAGMGAMAPRRRR